MEQLYEKVRNHPFFTNIEKETALELLHGCMQQTFQHKQVIFEANKQREGLLLLLSGVAEVYVEATNGRHEVLEVVQAGELIGFSSLADFLGISEWKESEQMVEVRATEEVLAILIPFTILKKRWDDQGIYDYLLTQVAGRLKDVYNSLAEQIKQSRQYGDSDTMVIRVQDMMSTPVLTASPSTPITEVARMMGNDRTSSVLITHDSIPRGIITERDLVNRVLAKGQPATITAEKIMTSKPITISRFSYYYDALSILLQHGIKHLPVMDGDKLVGIVTLSDLLRKKNESMMKTIQTIETARETTLPKIKPALYDVLGTLIKGNVPTFHLLDIMTRLNDRIVHRCIELAIDSIGTPPPCPFCFYQMGSSGRAEQVLLTDQDHFLVYENIKSNLYFEQLSNEIVRLLELAGYERCKGRMMSNYPNWRGDISTWKERIHSWSIQATNENLLLTQNFLSYRKIYGDQQLHQDFEKGLTDQLKRGKILLYRLTELEREHQVPTLEQPLRALFNLQRKQLDMKKEVLFPTHHCLQILALKHGILSGTPLERIDRLIDSKALSTTFGEDLKQSIEELLSIYIKHRWNQHKQNQPLISKLQLIHLSTREKEILTSALKRIRELQLFAVST
ncbi:DUF294 nucleotidyltransferase-like domain-containing protein [Bacillus sp. PS06]|uniref:DUF294 nucleotidyltransferase-like domain-containing protein n=1 Tax=Bacillus sp. PS06 TaxID=2764176 RepID=UPI00177D3B53|nr:DUF294 nucleotidyltransferase-like domain-containing protein [Bacillus sp. PS06]MBD8069464.1 CBS domain-containing protein [Bacillus sp. PS06]